MENEGKERRKKRSRTQTNSEDEKEENREKLIYFKTPNSATNKHFPVNTIHTPNVLY
jgi:hypothetical protein